MKISRKTFILTGVLGIFLIGISLALLFVKNTFGSNVFSVTNKGCVPYNLFVEKGSNDYSVKISWNTKDECVGFIQYGSDRGDLDLVGVDLTNKAKSKVHTVTLDKLLTTQKYYYLVNSDEQGYGYNGSALDFSINDL